MKTCRRCGVELVPGENWYPSQEKHSNYICKTCVKERWRDRYASNRSKVCKILRDHSEWLKDDPERLSTDFILSLVNDRGKNERDV